MLKKILILIFFFILTPNLFAYYSFNQRNHAEIKWKSIESEHIEIVYHDPLYDTAVKAMRISEATYASLVKTYDIELDDKIQIFITDQDKITNGYSAAGKYIAIWVDVNDYINIFTGREKWLRKVLSHEISHHFVFHSIKSWVDILFPVSAIGFPSDFNEGYAMFFSGEEWGYGREDANLRKGVFSNDISYDHPDGYFYTTGFSMVRYLYEFYGIEKLQELLKYRNKMKIFSFKAAFKKTYNKSIEEFKEEWRRYVYTYYFGTAYEMKSMIGDTSSSNSINNIHPIKIKGWKDLKYSAMKDSLIMFMGKGTTNQHYYDLAYGYFYPDTLLMDTLKIENIHKIESVSNARDFAISSNLKYCSYVKYERGNHGSIIPIIYLYDIDQNKKIRTISGQLAQIDTSGGIYFQQMTHDNNLVKYWKTGNEKTVLTRSSMTAIGELLLSGDEKHLAILEFDENSKFLLSIYSTQNFELIIQEELETFPRKAFWQDNENLIISMPLKAESRVTIKKFNITTHQWEEFKTPPYNFVAQGIEINDTTYNAIGYAQLDRTKNSLVKIELNKVDSMHYQPNVNYYSRWIHTKYPNEIVISDTIPNITEKKYSHLKNIEPYANLIWPDNQSLFWMTFWMDPLMKHTFIMSGILEYDGMKPYLVVNYANRCLWPTINLDYTKYVWTGGLQDKKWYYYDIERASLSMTIPVDLFKNPFTHFNIATGIAYQNVTLQDEMFDIQPIFDDGNALTSESFVQVFYNLPFENAMIHPVRKFRMNYNLSMANSALGMKKDFVEQEFDFEISVAPLYDFFSLKIDELLFTNKTNFNFINGDYFSQYYPGIDMQENIPIGGGIISERHYLRGIEKTLVGQKLIITKNELWLKIFDDLNLSINFGGPLLDISYLGVGLWTDYGKIWVDEEIFNFQTGGYELKALLNVFGIPTIQRFGRAYNFDNDALNYYYQMNIPLDFGI